MGEVPTAQSSDIDTALLIVSVDLFTNFRRETVTLSLQTGGFWSDTIASSIFIGTGLCRFNTPNWRILKRYNCHINWNKLIVSELGRFIASKWCILKQYTNFFTKTSLLAFTSSLIVILSPLKHSHGFYIFSWPLQHTHTASFGTLTTSTGTLMVSISSLTASIITFMASTLSGLFLTSLESLQALSFL